MEKVHMDSVVDFDYGCLYHKDLLESISEYDFIQNPTILLNFVKTNLDIDIALEDLELYCDCFDNIYFAFYNGNEHIYLVSAFNVYSREVYEEEYVRDENLTKKWQAVMKTNFSESTYDADLEDKLTMEKANADEIF